MVIHEHKETPRTCRTVLLFTGRCGTTVSLRLNHNVRFSVHGVGIQYVVFDAYKPSVLLSFIPHSAEKFPSGLLELPLIQGNTATILTDTRHYCQY